MKCSKLRFVCDVKVVHSKFFPKGYIVRGVIAEGKVAGRGLVLCYELFLTDTTPMGWCLGIQHGHATFLGLETVSIIAGSWRKYCDQEET